MATKRYLITGDAGTGKSSIANHLQTIGWEDKFDWIWREEALRQLLNLESNEALFLCGVSRNQSTFYHLFDKIFLLHLNISTMKNRLTNRTNSSFGKRASDIKASLGWHDELEHNVLAAGAIVIDATQSINKVAREILGHTP